jgi:hypothetical protein
MPKRKPQKKKDSLAAIPDDDPNSKPAERTDTQMFHWPSLIHRPQSCQYVHICSGMNVKMETKEGHLKDGHLIKQVSDNAWLIELADESWQIIHRNEIQKATITDPYSCTEFVHVLHVLQEGHFEIQHYENDKLDGYHSDCIRFVCHGVRQ